LSRLLRGLAGTEAEARRPVAAGALIVRLDEALVPLTSDPSDLGRTAIYRVGPAGRDHADPSVASLTATPVAEGLKPLSPVHVRARREEGGIRLTWVRRTRRDGDAWEPVDVPLGEAMERYEIDILSGDLILRTLSSTAPEVLYAHAQEIEDFGSVQMFLRLRVVQLSAVVGRGFAREIVVPVHSS
jgi:hypothetical protein